MGKTNNLRSHGGIQYYDLTRNYKQFDINNTQSTVHDSSPAEDIGDGQDRKKAPVCLEKLKLQPLKGLQLWNDVVRFSVKKFLSGGNMNDNFNES